MTLYLALSTLIFIVALVVLYWMHTQAALEIVATPAPPPPGGPRISVIIPARNEEANIQRCVEAVLAQDYPNFEALVLDDRSTDSTPAILTGLSRDDSRLVILFGDELPEGWAGKPHALYQAARAATGEWLCFVDADTFLEPNALSAVLHNAQKTDADLYTMMTRQIMGTFWEKVILPLVFTAVSIGFSPRKVNDPRKRDAVANGQFIFIKRSVYDAVGGHAALKNQIVEDKALAEQVKWNGYRLVLADGYNLAKTRMYTSLPGMWEGWTKNIYLGLKDRPGMLLLGAFGAFLALTATLFMPFWPLFGLVWFFNGGGFQAVLALIEALIVWAAMLYARARVAHAMRISRGYALTTPIGAAVFAAMMFVSAWKSLAGQGIRWKGRTYDSKKVR
ncbi:MAG: glycosyltransferase [Anaerolineales bacterium]